MFTGVPYTRAMSFATVRSRPMGPDRDACGPSHASARSIRARQRTAPEPEREPAGRRSSAIDSIRRGERSGASPGSAAPRCRESGSVPDDSCRRARDRRDARGRRIRADVICTAPTGCTVIAASTSVVRLAAGTARRRTDVRDQAADGSTRRRRVTAKGSSVDHLECSAPWIEGARLCRPREVSFVADATRSGRGPSPFLGSLDAARWRALSVRHVGCGPSATDAIARAWRDVGVSETC